MVIFLLNPVLNAALIGGGTALLMGAIILVVFHYFSVEKDPLQEELEGVLPGVNCGGCGYSGCSAYASALADKSEETRHSVRQVARYGNCNRRGARC